MSVVDFSMSHGSPGECGMPTVPGLPLSVTLTGVCDGVDLASPSIKRNLNICQGTVNCPNFGRSGHSNFSCANSIVCSSPIYLW